MTLFHRNSLVVPLLLLLLTTACQEPVETADAYGNFEAREIIVSAEAAGKILRFDVEEGQDLGAAQVVGIIDTIALHLRREQLRASIQAVRQKTQDPQPQIDVLQEQRHNLLRERDRLDALLRDQAATPKQLDDINGQIKVVDEQIAAAAAQARTANRGILAEVAPLEAQIRLLDDQIRRSYVANPIDGTVLVKLAEPGEMINAGMPLYKIADLRDMTLRAYVTGAQLPHLRLGQTVTVLIDEDETRNKAYTGAISWIADQAEFTPKIVQTKEERVNLVYAIKITVPNEEGRLKIGMPGEVRLSSPQETTGAASASEKQ